MTLQERVTQYMRVRKIATVPLAAKSLGISKSELFEVMIADSEGKVVDASRILRALDEWEAEMEQGTPPPLEYEDQESPPPAEDDSEVGGFEEGEAGATEADLFEGEPWDQGPGAFRKILDAKVEEVSDTGRVVSDDEQRDHLIPFNSDSMPSLREAEEDARKLADPSLDATEEQEGRGEDQESPSPSDAESASGDSSEGSSSAPLREGGAVVHVAPTQGEILLPFGRETIVTTEGHVNVYLEHGLQRRAAEMVHRVEDGFAGRVRIGGKIVKLRSSNGEDWFAEGVSEDVKGQDVPIIQRRRAGGRPKGQKSSQAAPRATKSRAGGGKGRKVSSKSAESKKGRRGGGRGKRGEG